MKKLTSRNLAICNMYTERYWPITDIGKHFNISRQRVYQILEENGIKTDKSTRHLLEKQERDKAVMEAVEQGKTYSDIARDAKSDDGDLLSGANENLPMSRTTIMRIVKDNR